MSLILAFIILTIVQFLVGFGILSLFRIQLKTPLMLSLSVLSGIAVMSFLPFLLQLFYVPLTGFNIFLSLIIAMVLLFLPVKKRMEQLRDIFSNTRFRIRLYELPALGVIIFITLVSAWRCFYFPPTPRDLTSGPEVIAEYTVKEKTMINSVFTVDLSTTNNQFKPPFITALQVVYKYAGFSFGQVWLTTIFICFLVFLYHALGLHIHRLLAGLLLVFFLAIPEMYAYSFMVLFDYPNAVFFFLSCWFLFSFFSTRHKKYLFFSAFLMGVATYIRSETLVLAGLLSLVIAWHHIKNWDSLKKLATSVVIFLLPAMVLYLLSVTVYINFYLPSSYDVGNLVNTNLVNPLPFFDRFISMNDRLFFSSQGVKYYGYFLFLFLILLVVDIVFNTRISATSRNWLYAVLVIYFGYPLLGYLLPLLDIDHSTKRGLFKIFPLMLFYMGSSTLLVNLSADLTAWELRTKKKPSL